jgi:hypothetical protein
MAKYVKNNKTTKDTWCGQEIEPGTYYEIEPIEEVKWANDDKTIISITNGELIVSNGDSADANINNINRAINHLKNIPEQLDSDGASLIRPKAAKAGWTYHLLPIEFTTSKLSSLYAKKPNGDNRSGITYQIFNSDGDEISGSQYESTAVKTVVNFEPTYDYEVIGGHIQQHTKPTTDVRLYVVAVPDVSEAYGGSKEMVGGVNLKFIDPTDRITADGRVSKYMVYNSVYHTNEISVIVRHEAGVQHELLLLLEIFKA